MPKLKTHKGAKKRFKITGSGKVKRQRPYTRHLFTAKSAKRKRHLRSAGYVDSTDMDRVKKLLPYG
jgi:large subunit ribosomal protein L35